VFSGQAFLVATDSYICDDRYATSVGFPTVSKKVEMFCFTFVENASDTPTYSVEQNANGIVITVSLGKTYGNHLATSSAVATNIEGKDYSYLFCLTRLVGHSVRVEISLFETRGEN
jgi:hypothetical protein